VIADTAPADIKDRNGLRTELPAPADLPPARHDLRTTQFTSGHADPKIR
jgi:hypothetical protein